MAEVAVMAELRLPGLLRSPLAAASRQQSWASGARRSSLPPHRPGCKAATAGAVPGRRRRQQQRRQQGQRQAPARCAPATGQVGGRQPGQGRVLATCLTCLC